MNNLFPTRFAGRCLSMCLALAVIGLTGCDSSTGVGGGGDVTVEGRVTDESGFGKTAGTQDNVEGAVVTAANVSASGSLNQLDGEATTNADGRFTLSVDDAADEVVVVAQKAGFESRAMVFTGGAGSVSTMPLTAESRAEANVFVEARRQDDADDVRMSDVAVFVTSEVAADVDAGTRSAADVAASIVAEAAVRSDYVRDQGSGDEADEVRENHDEAFIELQLDLAASADAEAESAAMERFEEALIEAYTDAGVAIEIQAKARESARAALIRFGSASFEMQKKATILASIASAHAVEASFDGAGASSARLSALAQARDNLIAELRAASSSAAVAEARADYESAVEAELAAEADVEQSVLASASSAISTAKTALDVALTTAGNATAVANAYAAYYTSAEASAETALEGTTANASFAAEVLAMLSAS